MCREECPQILPEESPDAQAVLNGHHYHIFKCREGQPIIGGRPTQCQSTSVDPHHHLSSKERTILVIGNRIGKELRRCLVWFAWPGPDSGHHHSKFTGAQLGCRNTIIRLPQLTWLEARMSPHSMVLSFSLDLCAKSPQGSSN